MTRVIVISMITIWMLSGCGSSQFDLNNHISPTNNDELFDFPEFVDLQYENIIMETLKENADSLRLKKHKSIPFGEVVGESIVINLYSNDDEESDIVGVLDYKDKSYMTAPISYSHDIKSVETYILQNEYIANDERIHLVGAIGSPASGYQYVFYYEKKNLWQTYHNWGSPKLIDLNKDGNNEVIIQFQGMGNNFADFNILSCETNGFKIASINSSLYASMSIDTAINRISSTITDENDSDINVAIVGNSEQTSKYTFYSVDRIKLKN